MHYSVTYLFSKRLVKELHELDNTIKLEQLY